MAGYGKATVDNKLSRLRSVLGLRNSWKVSDNDAADSGGDGLLDFLDEVRLATGSNTIRLINDMETVGDWTESDSGTFDIAVNTSGKVGTNAQKFTATAAGDGSQNIETNVIDGGDVLVPGGRDGLGHRAESMNWEDTDFVGCWVQADTAADFGSAGELRLNIENKGVWGTAVNVPATSGTNTNWERYEVDITSFARDQVTKIRFELHAGAAAGEDVSIDELIRYKFGNGYGPVMGRCQWFPLADAATVARGNIVNISDLGLAAVTSAADSQDIGPCVVGGTGGTDYDGCWVQISGHSFFPVGTTVTEDETLIWGAGHKLLADAGTTSVDFRVIARMPDGTTVTEESVVLLEWGNFINDGAQLVS